MSKDDKVLPILMFCALPASGKSESRRFFKSLTKEEMSQFHLGDSTTQVDDYPYGGGEGMIMTAEPIFQTFMHIKKERGVLPYLIMMSPRGKILDESVIKRIRTLKNISILCGRYEGVDQRLIDEIVDEEISIGNYVVSGGELPAMVFLDSILRTIDGVLSSSDCYINESHFNGKLEHSQYTRPRVWHGREVPEVLLSGNHEKINKWKMK